MKSIIRLSLFSSLLFVGAAGGFGRYGADTLAHLGSTDKTAHVVELHPPQARAVEFGHADLFLADKTRAS